MADRLYYQDSYLRAFSARVVERGEADGHPFVTLDRTAFYPGGGGQPPDTGKLAGIPVLEAQEDGRGEVLHFLADASQSLVPGMELTGEIDWPRRFDHMQQHTGQHILSAAFIQAASAETVAFHLGTDYTTIDLNRTGLTTAQVDAAEALANAVIAENRSVIARFVSDDEIGRLPLRRPPKADGPIRVVQVAGFDWSGCGGTHVGSTAAVGLIKIVKVERRGAETRITFLCGGRALADYGRKHRLTLALMERFSAGESDVIPAIERLDADALTLRKMLREAEQARAQAEASALWTQAPQQNSIRLVQAVYRDRSTEAVKSLSLALQAQTRCIALLAWVGADGRVQLTFVSAPGTGADMGTLLRSAVTPLGGRGGGRPEWAQGGLPDASQVETALNAARAALGF
ncbi:MAG: alanyl-tRNA editing protein [Anaerolineae bacterium]|nr:alanyl-tRNA editing protein [Anaerolineae bacterium]